MTCTYNYTYMIYDTYTHAHALAIVWIGTQVGMPALKKHPQENEDKKKEYCKQQFDSRSLLTCPTLIFLTGVGNLHALSDLDW